MQLNASRAFAAFIAFLLLAFVLIDVFPVYGPPAFRYTGSDPKHLVWNLGWPIPWIIYDKFTPPHWFVWLGDKIWMLFVPQAFAVILPAAAIMTCAMIGRLARKRNADKSSSK